MDGELQTLLKGNNVDDIVCAWLLKAPQGVKTVKNYANFLESRADVQKDILDHINTHKENSEQRTALKQAWREADALSTARLKRTAEGLSEEIAQEPLPEIQQTQLVDCFRIIHGQFGDIADEDMGSDVILGKFFREFERRKPTMMEISKMRSIATAHLTPGSKRTRLSANVDVVYTEPVAGSIKLNPRFGNTNRTTDAHKFDEFFKLFTILINTWSVAGCTDITYGSGDSAIKRKYCCWHEAKRYFKIFNDKGWRLTRTYTFDSIIEYLTVVEELMRREAIQYAKRSLDPLPWSMALIKAADGDAFWKQEEDILVKLGTTNNPWLQETNAKGSKNGKGGKGGGGKGGKGGGKGGKGGGDSAYIAQRQAANTTTPIPDHVPGWRKFSFSKEDHFRKPICDPFNNNKGCPNKDCNRGRHCCNVRLKNGHICEGRHSRSSHDPAQHGEPMTLGRGKGKNNK